MPISAPASAGQAVRALGSVERSTTPYGFSSRLIDLDGASIPTNCEYSEAEKSALPSPKAGGTVVRYAISFFHFALRLAWNPQTCVVPGWYRIDLNGMAASIAQPPSKSAVATSHTGFQSALYCRSLTLCPSVLAPRALTSNCMALRRSKNVSKENPTASPCRILLLSRRISLVIRRLGSLSQMRIDTYTLLSSKATQTSVFSVAGWPPLGSIWMKPPSGSTVL